MSVSSVEASVVPTGTPGVTAELGTDLLPTTVARFRELALAGEATTPRTVILDTAAWMRRPRLPRIPLEIRMSHRLGSEFVNDIRIGRGRLSFRFGLDAFIAGRGLMRIGPSIQTGPSFDQGALIALWAEALNFPGTWRQPGVRWEPVDATTSTLVVPGPEGEIPIRVGFDPDTGFPAWCEADRYKSSGPKVRWRGTSSQWRRFPGGVLAPSRFGAAWADEAEPWLDVEVRSVVVDGPIEATFELGRRAFERAAEAGPRS
jgi:hypothetical protein